MKKNMILTILILLGLCIITACGNKDNLEDKKDNEKVTETKKVKNAIVCSSNNLSFLNDVIIRGYKDDDNSGNNDDLNWKVYFYNENEDIEKGEYTFVYNDDTLNYIEGKEVYKESSSSTITDKDLEELNKVFKAYIKDGKVVIEYKIEKDDNMLKAFKATTNTKEELKDFLEEKGSLSCKIED